MMTPNPAPSTIRATEFPANIVLAKPWCAP